MRIFDEEEIQRGLFNNEITVTVTEYQHERAVEWQIETQFALYRLRSEPKPTWCIFYNSPSRNWHRCGHNQNAYLCAVFCLAYALGRVE